MKKERLVCPECGNPISVYPKIEKTGEIIVVITCETCDEYEGLTIKTGLKTRDLKKFSKPLGKPVLKEMKIQ